MSDNPSHLSHPLNWKPIPDPTLNGQIDWKPRPDPTVLTAAMIEHEITALNAVCLARDQSTRALIDARLTGMDKALELLQTILDRRPGEFDAKTDHLSKIIEEKFRTTLEKFSGVSQEIDGIQRQFQERDIRADATSLANKEAVATAFLASKEAVAAALQAQKEAAREQATSFEKSIDKSERATGEQIAQQRVQVDVLGKGIDGQLGDVKERVTRIEALAVGISVAKTDIGVTQTHAQTGNAFMLSLFVAGISLTGLVALLIRDFAR